MSEQKQILAENILKQIFGEDVARVAQYIGLWNGSSFMDLNDNLPNQNESLVILNQHNLTLFKKCDKTRMNECHFYIDEVMNLVKYPKYLNIIRKKFSDSEMGLLEIVMKNGRISATEAIVLAVKEKSGGEFITQDLIKTKDSFFKLIYDCYLRKHSNIDTTAFSDLTVEDKITSFTCPVVELSEIEEKLKNPAVAVKSKDEEVLWQVNHSKFLRHYRDNLITECVKRRIDSKGGQLMQILLDVANAHWGDSMSSRFYYTGISDEVLKRGDQSLRKYFNQYMKLLQEDTMRFMDWVGDENGGAFQINFVHVFERLATAVIENVIMEKFSLKALRIFRAVKEKKYIEEAQIQRLVMMPPKETKELTYQLLENHFLHSQELKKSLASNVQSKSFFLFYVDINRVARMVMEMTYKTISNLIARQTHTLEINRKLLMKKDKVEEMISELQSATEMDQADFEAQLQEVQELLSPQENCQAKYAIMCNDKLKNATYQVDDTLFILNLYLLFNLK